MFAADDEDDDDDILVGHYDLDSLVSTLHLSDGDLLFFKDSTIQEKELTAAEMKRLVAIERRREYPPSSFPPQPLTSSQIHRSDHHAYGRSAISSKSSASHSLKIQQQTIDIDSL